MIIKEIIQKQVPHWIIKERVNIHNFPDLSSVYYHLIIPKGYDKYFYTDRFIESYENAKTTDTVLTKLEEKEFNTLKYLYTKKKEDNVFEINEGQLESILL